MSSTILPTILIAAVAGGAAATMTSLVLKPEKTEEVAAISPTSDSSELALEIEGLRKSNAALLERLDALEMSAALAGETRTPALEPASVDIDLEQELRALMASMKVSSDGGVSRDFQNSVSAALESIRAEEEAERDAKREERRQERTEERLSELAEKLGLNPTQVDSLRTHYSELEAKRTEMFALARELDDWGSMREDMRALRDEAETGLQNIFSPAQFQQYQDENLGGGFGGFRGGRGGGGGGGGFGGGGGRRGGN